MATADVPFYKHEFEAISRIINGLSKRSDLVKLFPNVEVPDSYNKFSECDLILVTPWFGSIVELKHWHGKIQVGELIWQRDSNPINNPHQSNQFKCKSLASWLGRELPAIKPPQFDSTVILTDENASVDLYEGATSLYREKRANKTFAGIAIFLHTIENRINDVGNKPRLTDQEFDRVVEKLTLLKDRPKYFATQVPGFQIFGALSETPLVSEYLAYAEGMPDKRPKRLRIFGFPSNDAVQSARQTRNFSALEGLTPHPNILKGNYHANEKHLIVEVTNWSEQGSLRDLINQRKVLPPETVAKFTSQLLSALKHIHQSGIVHRDIRPENILVTGDTVQVTNFDFSYDPSADFSVFTDEYAQAFLSYRAPEIFSRTATASSDIYSLGIVVCELMGGVPPIAGWQDLSATDDRLPEHVIKDLRRLSPKLAHLVDSSVRLDASIRPSAGKLMEPFLEPNVVSTRSETLNVWSLAEKINSGATAEVFKALKSGEETVAIKMFHVDQPPDLARRECEFAKRCPSPFVVKAYTHFVWSDGRGCIEMEYIDGQSLRHRIESGCRPTEDEFRQVSSNLFQALDEMHQQGDSLDGRAIIHNDLSPSNILLSTGGPKIIDFALASQPGLGPICGVPKYTAPDLVSGAELNRCPSGDLFSLTASLFEWLTGFHPFGNEVPGARKLIDLGALDLPSKLANWFTKGLSFSGKTRFRNASEALGELIHVYSSAAISSSIIQYISETEDIAALSEADMERSEAQKREAPTEAFVDYINTLHNSSAANKHALAEAQALSEFFGTIQVDHPISDHLIQIFDSDPKAIVVLTGHAGDGKSTIALDLYKHYSQIDKRTKLDKAMSKIEQVHRKNGLLNIVKDMSEANEGAEREEIFRKALETDGSHLIVTNTGPLLTTCGALFDLFDFSDRLSLESALLRVLQKPSADLSSDHAMTAANGRKIWIANLSTYDNLFMVQKFLGHLAAHPEWEKCSKCPAVERCPIRNNARTVAVDSIVSDRIGLIYRRLSAYGKRITARQLTAHLGFSLTGGLSCRDVVSKTGSSDLSLKSTYFLSNTLFGYEGVRRGKSAKVLHVANLIDELEPGTEPDCTIDTELIETQMAPEVNIDSLKIYKHLCSGLNEISRDQRQPLRHSIRRFLFLCAAFPPKREHIFLSHFVRSEKLIDYVAWRQAGLSKKDSHQLRDRILTALLEHYTGIRSGQYSRLPKNVLYLTLKRTDTELQQVVQIILRTYPFDMFKVVFHPQQILQLTMIHPDFKHSLELPLPVLDYVERICRGVLGTELDDIYINRLELFKSQLLAHDRDRAPSGALELLEVATDGTVRKCDVELIGGKVRAQYL